MSKAYVIDKDGIIIETIVAWCSQDNGNGTRIVKFKNEDEERRLIAMSETQKRIKQLQEEMKKLAEELTLAQAYRHASVQKVESTFSRLAEHPHETYIPGQVQALMAQWLEMSSSLTGDALAANAAHICRKGLGLMETLQQKKLEHLTAQDGVLARVASLQQEIRTLEAMDLVIQTTEGKERFPAEIDQRTNGALQALMQELNDICLHITEASPQQVQEYNLRLEAMESELSRLPEQAQRVFAQQMNREEEMMSVAQRLQDAGWEILSLQRGNTSLEDCSLFIKGKRGEKASIRFSLENLTEIISHFQEDAAKTREQLQQLVLQTIQDRGEKAKGTCLDDVPSMPQAGKDAVLPEAEDQPTQLRQQLHVASNQGRTVSGQ